MGSKYPVLSPHEIIKVLEKLGFKKTSQKENHAKYKKLGKPTKVVTRTPHVKYNQREFQIIQKGIVKVLSNSCVRI